MEELLELAIFLVVKFWPVILAFLGFKAIGKVMQEAKKKPVARRPVLTPVHGGGFPMPQPGRAIVTRKEEEREEQDLFPYEDRENEERERERWLDSSVAVQPSFQANTSAVTKRSEQASNQKRVDAFTEREGMKWALIFSPPRAKMPYTPPGYQKRQ